MTGRRLRGELRDVPRKRRARKGTAGLLVMQRFRNTGLTPRNTPVTAPGNPPPAAFIAPNKAAQESASHRMPSMNGPERMPATPRKRSPGFGTVFG